MSPVRVTMRRTIGMARSLYSTAFAFGGFLAGAAALFAFNLDAAEGGQSKLSSIWTVSVSPVLPILAALLGMDTWSDERRSGRIELLLSSPIREKDFVLGKFLGVWAMTVFGAAVFLFASLSFLKAYAPQLIGETSLPGFLPGFAALVMQGALWSAVSVAASALFSNAAAAATATTALLVALPRGLWAALSSWGPQGRTSFGEMPIDAQAFDFASGLVSTGTVLAYVIFTATTLFVASKAVAGLRCGSRGASTLRFTTRLSSFLAVVFAVLAATLAYRLDLTLDLPVGGTGDTRFSARTRSVLSEARGAVSITAFLERSDPRFRQLGHFLRALKREADEVSGIRIDLRYVDPTLDLGEAQRLVRAGVGKDSLVFERNGRIADAVRLADGYSERLIASIIERVALPFQRSCVYWTSGHGEASFADYGAEGMSDIARDLSLDGYGNRTIDLASDTAIADDCALIVVAGARTDFSSVELDRIRAYLEGRGGKNEGGRLLVLLDSADTGGIPTLLSEWGIRPVAASLVQTRTISGTDVIVTDFTLDHAVTRPFEGQQVVLEKPISFVPSAAAAGDVGSGADLKRFQALLRAGGACLAAGVERGEAGADLAIRPTRVIAVGDVGFVMNGKLRAYANANRDFFLNAVKYLSGRDALTESGTEADRLVSGMDRETRSRFVVAFSLAFPGAFFLLLVAAVAKRRRRQ